MPHSCLTHNIRRLQNKSSSGCVVSNKVSKRAHTVESVQTNHHMQKMPYAVHLPIPNSIAFRHVNVLYMHKEYHSHRWKNELQSQSCRSYLVKTMSHDIVLTYTPSCCIPPGCSLQTETCPLSTAQCLGNEDNTDCGTSHTCATARCAGLPTFSVP